MNSKSNSVILKSKLALLGFAFLIPLHSHAGSSSTTMAVSATVLTACTIAATPLAFGNYDTSAGAVNVNSNIDVICTGSSSYAIALGKGLGSGATFAARKLSGVGAINYSIYTDNTYATVWGDGTSGTSTVTGTGTLGTSSHTVYGRIPAGQSAQQGLYVDTVTVNLTY